jgi:hypothetical protein
VSALPEPVENKQQDGLRIPMYGEVGWHDGGSREPVWKATIVEAAYEARA